MKVARNAEEQQKQKQAAMSLLKRLPPQDVAEDLTSFIRIAPHLEQALAPPLVSKPLRIENDPEHNKDFIACNYNSDGGAFRSPWSNKYFRSGKLATGGDTELFRPSERLRRLEETFNEVFEAYKTSYYEGGVSSVFLWDMDEGFAGAFLIHKECSQDRGVEHGVWDSVHVLEVKEPARSNSLVDYKLSTTVLLHMKVGEAAGTESSSGETELGVKISRQAEDKRKKTGDDSHLLHMGHMIEDMEISIRQSLDVVCMAKQREVLGSVRRLEGTEPLRMPEPQQSRQVPPAGGGQAG